jgi:hypothetical protein
MKLLHALAATAACLALASPHLAAAGSDADDGSRAEIRKATGALLQQFYAARPRLVPEVKASAGYAIFTTYSGNLVGTPGSGGRGMGVALNPRDSTEKFMGMRQTSPDPNALVDRELLIVFTSQKAFEEFALRGWKDGAVVSDAKVYSLSRAGAVEVSPSLAGARFWNEGALN